MNVIGKQFINGERVAKSDKKLYSYDAATGEALPYTFYQALSEEADAAAKAAAVAYPLYRKTSLQDRAEFLSTIAEEIDALGDEFIHVLMREAGMSEERVRSERTRTSNQLRLFADVVRKGDYLGCRIDRNSEDIDVRQYQIGIGPVVVFGASNFPLAFSVAGGDTASALAAGCPVIVKAHSGHQATGEMIGQAITVAVKRCNMPAGVFGMVFGRGVGADLVKAPEVKAVGFTGSLSGGRILCDLAAARPEPIPVFAEMSSTNPVVMMPKALANRGSEIAEELADSVTHGVGQFCTNAGLVIGFEGPEFEAFSKDFSAAMSRKAAATMLNKGTLDSYTEGLERMHSTAGVELIASGDLAENCAHACAFKADASLFKDLANPLEEEVFGPCTTLVTLKNQKELLDIVPGMGGQLTASIFAEPDELEQNQDLIEAFEARVGRLILNQYTIGLHICDAIIHGGPYPATSDSRGTSVGTLAINRFIRPVCYQGYPDSALPPALKNGNPLKLRRLVNNEWSEGVIEN